MLRTVTVPILNRQTISIILVGYPKEAVALPVPGGIKGDKRGPEGNQQAANNRC
jgi:hypothetical protein